MENDNNTERAVSSVQVQVQDPQEDPQAAGEEGGPVVGRKPITNKDLKKRLQEHVAEREAELALRNESYVLQYLLRKTHFDKDQVRALMQIYKAFKGTSPMDRLRFREMVASCFGTTDNVMLDRIFQAFDADNLGTVSETEWIIGLSIQLKGTLDEQIAYTYGSNLHLFFLSKITLLSVCLICIIYYFISWSCSRRLRHKRRQIIGPG